jgi:ZIP family zinc transporter
VEHATRERTKIRLRAGWVAAAALGLLSIPAVVLGIWKLLAIAWTAFAAMAAGAVLGGRAQHAVSPRRLVWSYGLASGAMVASAAVFLVPPAIGHHAAGGGLGLAAGLIAGFALHAAGHQLTHRLGGLRADPAVTELTVHALSAGLIIGLVYAAMPALGLLLGLAIVSHKGPAGYVTARRLKRSVKRGTHPAVPVLLPASAVGITALPVGVLNALFAWPAAPVVQAVIFGFAAGVFLHVAMDFLPRCELGGEIHEAIGREEADHALLDRLRTHAAFSTAVGGAAVALAWFALGGWG